jgi:hypothetical protein
MRVLPALAAVALGCAIQGEAQAAPRFDICEDVGPHFGFGISSFGAAGDWLEQASTDHGVTWRFVYVYLGPPGDDVDGYQWFINIKADVAERVGAMGMFTFYQLLHIGQGAGLQGSEAEVVQAVLGDAALMHEYFDNFVLVLETLADREGPHMVHVEPDSWGFMMWAMGIEGNDDATSVPVQVAGSGHPDVAGFPDHAGGLGQALVELRDLYAPEIRLGWHSSNFRVGTRPEVVSSFFAPMGDWDVLVGEHPHNELDDAVWWEPWDAERVQINVDWFSHVTSTTGLPIVLWQLPIGTVDWHLLEEPGDLSMLRAYAEAGVIGAAFEHQNGQGDATDPDDFRAFGAFGTPPPAGSPAGGTAAHMRTRVAAHSASPLAWPEASPCFAPDDGDDGTDDGGDGTGDGGGTGDGEGTGADDGGATGDGTTDTASGDDAGADEDTTGCGCRAPAPTLTPWLLLPLFLARRRSNPGVAGQNP